MSRSKVAPWLLAASVFLTGAAGVIVSGSPAYAITSVEELRDVDSSHWAYQALADLVEKYDVIEGYPDYTFKGKRQATRYEMAAALNALIKAVGRDLARLGAEKANKSDLATLARLQEEFRNELAALNSRTAALESRASAIEAKNREQDNRLDLLERTQLHGDFSVGLLYDVAPNGNVVPIGAARTNDGIEDAISTLGRFRLGVKVPVVQGHDNSMIGEGDVIARLVGAFGRWTPAGSGNAAVQNVFPISGYSALAGAASGFNEGFQQDSLNLGGVTTGLNVRQNLYVESAYYKQHFKPGIPVLSNWGIWPDKDNFRTTSDLYVGLVPWRFLFNRSPYKGDELNQFQNTALVNNQGLLVNNISPMLALAWHQGLGEHLSADLTGAIGTLSPSDFANGWHVTEELSFNYDTAFLGRSYTKPGNLYVGGYHIFFDGAVPNLFRTVGATLNRDGEAVAAQGTNNQNINALYVGWNQEWWRGIGTTVDWVLNEANVNNALITSLRNGTGANVALNTTARIVGINHALSAALTVPMTVFKRDLTRRAHDVWGFGYSLINPTSLGDGGQSNPTVIARANTFNPADEHVFETFYRWTINNSFTVVPSIQAIVNRFGVEQNDVNLVFGLRTNYVF